MTKEEILELKQDENLDKLIAEIVMKWHKFHLYVDGTWTDYHADQWHDENGIVKYQLLKEFKPSTNISCAWQVFEMIKSLGGWIEVAWNPKKKHYRCVIGGNLSEGKLKSVDLSGFKTAQEAICKVSIIAMIP